MVIWRNVPFDFWCSVRGTTKCVFDSSSTARDLTIPKDWTIDMYLAASGVVVFVFRQLAKWSYSETLALLTYLITQDCIVASQGKVSMSMQKWWGKEKTDPIHFAPQKHEKKADVALIVYPVSSGVLQPQAKEFLWQHLSIEDRKKWHVRHT